MLFLEHRRNKNYGDAHCRVCHVDRLLCGHFWGSLNPKLDALEGTLQSVVMRWTWCTSSDLQMRDLTQGQFPETWKVLHAAIQDGVAPGIVAGFWDRKNPNEIVSIALGHRRLKPSSQSINRETVFDLASLTKIFATATLTAVLVDRQWLSWETSVSSVLSEYPYPDVKIKHLLSHSAGYVAWIPFWEKLKNHFQPKSLNQISVQSRQYMMRQLVYQTQREVEPGQRTLYSDVSSLLLGFVLEELTQMPLDQAVKKYVWHPMGISHADFHRTNGHLKSDEKIAATEDSPWRGGVLQGYVHDENCWAMGGYAGHAGAFGRLRDVLHFARGWMGGFVSQGTLHEMWTRVVEPQGSTRTLGWDTPSDRGSSVGQKFSKNTVGHLGFTGTSLWIDMDAGLAVSLLTNRVHPTRENNKIKEFRPAFHNALRVDLGR